MILDRVFGKLFGKASNTTLRKAKLLRKRKKRDGLLSNVFTPEDRILLSGITAANDVVVVEHKNASVAVDVLENDTTNPGGNLYVLSAESGTYGSVSIGVNDQGEQRVVYTPNTDFIGTDTFTYYAMDDFGQSATGTVTLTIQPTDHSTNDTGGLLPRTELSNGFAPDGQDDYERVARGNYELILGGSTTDTEWITDAGGILRQFTTNTTTQVTITSRETASGWEYSEILTGDQTTNMAASGGSIGSESNLEFGYSFTASNNGVTEGYELTINGEGSGGPDGTSTGADDSAIVGYTSGTSYNGTIQFSENLATGTVTGSVVGTGGTSQSTTYEQSEEVDVDGTDVTITTTTTVSDGTTWEYLGTIAIITDWVSEEWDYAGSDIVSGSNNGVTQSGTVTAHGNGNSSFSRSLTSVMAAGGWRIISGTYLSGGLANDYIGTEGAFNGSGVMETYYANVTAFARYDGEGNIFYGDDSQVTGAYGTEDGEGTIDVRSGGTVNNDVDGVTAIGSYSSRRFAGYFEDNFWDYGLVDDELTLTSAQLKTTETAEIDSESDIGGTIDEIEGGYYSNGHLIDGEESSTVTLNFVNDNWTADVEGEGDGIADTDYTLGGTITDPTVGGSSSTTIDTWGHTDGEYESTWTYNFVEDDEGEFELVSAYSRDYIGGGELDSYLASGEHSSNNGDTISGGISNANGSSGGTFFDESVVTLSEGVWTVDDEGGNDGLTQFYYFSSNDSTTTSDDSILFVHTENEGDGFSEYDVDWDAYFISNNDDEFDLVTANHTVEIDGEEDIDFRYNGTYESEVGDIEIESTFNGSSGTDGLIDAESGVHFLNSEWTANELGHAEGTGTSDYFSFVEVTTTLDDGEEKGEITSWGESTQGYVADWHSDADLVTQADGTEEWELTNASDEVTFGGEDDHWYFGFSQRDTGSGSETNFARVDFNGFSDGELEDTTGVLLANDNWTAYQFGDSSGTAEDHFTFTSTNEDTDPDDGFFNTSTTYIDILSGYGTLYTSDYALNDDDEFELMSAYSWANSNGTEDVDYLGNGNFRDKLVDDESGDVTTVTGSGNFQGGSFGHFSSTNETNYSKDGVPGQVDPGWTMKDFGNANGDYDSFNFSRVDASTPTDAGLITSYSTNTVDTDGDYLTTWHYDYAEGTAGAFELTDATVTSDVSGSDDVTYTAGGTFDLTEDDTVTTGRLDYGGSTTGNFSQGQIAGFEDEAWDIYSFGDSDGGGTAWSDYLATTTTGDPSTGSDSAGTGDPGTGSTDDSEGGGSGATYDSDSSFTTTYDTLWNSRHNTGDDDELELTSAYSWAHTTADGGSFDRVDSHSNYNDGDGYSTYRVAFVEGTSDIIDQWQTTTAEYVGDTWYYTDDGRSEVEITSDMGDSSGYAYLDDDLTSTSSSNVHGESTAKTTVFWTATGEEGPNDDLSGYSKVTTTIDVDSTTGGTFGGTSRLTMPTGESNSNMLSTMTNTITYDAFDETETEWEDNAAGQSSTVTQVGHSNYVATFGFGSNGNYDSDYSETHPDGGIISHENRGSWWVSSHGSDGRYVEYDLETGTTASSTSTTGYVSGNNTSWSNSTSGGEGEFRNDSSGSWGSYEIFGDYLYTGSMNSASGYSWLDTYNADGSISESWSSSNSGSSSGDGTTMTNWAYTPGSGPALGGAPGVGGDEEMSGDAPLSGTETSSWDWSDSWGFTESSATTEGAGDDAESGLTGREGWTSSGTGAEVPEGHGSEAPGITGPTSRDGSVSGSSGGGSSSGSSSAGVGGDGGSSDGGGDTSDGNHGDFAPTMPLGPGKPIEVNEAMISISVNPRLGYHPQTIRCVSCHNAIIMGGGSFSDLPEGFSSSAARFGRVSTIRELDARIVQLGDYSNTANATVGSVAIVTTGMAAPSALVYVRGIAYVYGTRYAPAIGSTIVEIGNPAPVAIAGGAATLASYAPSPTLPRTLSQQRELARITSEVREELVDNFDVLARELSPDQIRAIVDEPWLLQLFFGTALESRVASRVRQVVRSNPDSVLSDVRWTGRTNAPQDFIGPGQHGFDITGSSPASIRSHFARPEIDAVITYDSIPRELGRRFIQWFDE